MIKISELLSKRLIALSTAESAGIIENVIFNDKLTCGKLVKVYNDDGAEPEIRYAELKKIKNGDFDACVIADKSYLSGEWNTAGALHENNPINSEVFNQSGKLLGRVTDVILQNTSVTAIVTDGGEFTPNRILAQSDRILIINDTGKPIKPYKRKTISVPVPRSAPETSVTVHAEQTPKTEAPTQAVQTVQTTTAAEKKEPDETIILPARVPPENTLVTRTPAKEESVSPYNFLIGKTLSKDIAADNGVIILRRHAVINDDVIASARDHGKLVQLALHAE